MKVDIKELRAAIRQTLKEELDEISSSPTMTPTIPASKSPEELAFSKDMAGKKWGNTRKEKSGIPQGSLGTAKNKHIRVYNYIAQNNLVPAEQRETLMDDIDSFLKTKDPGDALISSVESLADEFMKSRAH